MTRFVERRIKTCTFKLNFMKSTLLDDKGKTHSYSPIKIYFFINFQLFYFLYQKYFLLTKYSCSYVYFLFSSSFASRVYSPYFFWQCFVSTCRTKNLKMKRKLVMRYRQIYIHHYTVLKFISMNVKKWFDLWIILISGINKTLRDWIIRTS